MKNTGLIKINRVVFKVLPGNIFHILFPVSEFSSFSSFFSRLLNSFWSREVTETSHIVQIIFLANWLIVCQDPLVYYSGNLACSFSFIRCLCSFNWYLVWVHQVSSQEDYRRFVSPLIAWICTVEEKYCTCSTFFNYLRMKSSTHRFDGVGVVYLMHGMRKHIQENHLDIRTTAKKLHLCLLYIVFLFRLYLWCAWYLLGGIQPRKSHRSN